MPKPYKTGLVIGKFYPPHKGHKYLINTAHSQCEKLVVMVCDKEGQEISGSLRAEWLREIHPYAEVRIVPDVLHDDDSRGWAESTLRWLGYAPDAVFTSEDYGDSYCEYLGSKHVLVDKSRLFFPISGTAVRKDPIANWNFIEPCVRAYYAKRVVVVGAESTGTTTLAKNLAQYYKTAWVSEYGRTYWEAKMHIEGANKWETEEFLHIARTQNRLEDDMARKANRVLICDTNSFATCLWHERYMGFWPDEVEREAAGRRCDLYIVTDADIPFVQDGTRDGEYIRKWMHARFVEELERRGYPYAVVSGSRARRLKKAVNLIEKILFESAGKAREYNGSNGRKMLDLMRTTCYSSKSALC
jgi:HTH-type transcriptional regulator, transcriptional repressor of NAD biosynthesis genes